MPTNGSVATGGCTDFTIHGNMSTCEQPTSSVLFHYNVPTELDIGLNRDYWATQLLTLHTEVNSTPNILFHFGNPRFIRVITMVFFNCPQWGISVDIIDVYGAQEYTDHLITRKGIDFGASSCESLVHICIPIYTTTQLIEMDFDLPPHSDWVHIKEIRFLGDSDSVCSRDYILHPSGKISSRINPLGTSREMSRLESFPNFRGYFCGIV